MKKIISFIKKNSIGSFKQDINLSKVTTYKVGGTASLFVYPKDFEKLILLIKDLLVSTMVEQKVSFYDLSTKQVGISKALKDRLNNTFDEYGIEVKDFVLESVVLNDTVRDEVEKAYLARQVDVIKNQLAENETIKTSNYNLSQHYEYNSALKKSIQKIKR